jgi:hypothetical protein
VITTTRSGVIIRHTVSLTRTADSPPATKTRSTSSERAERARVRTSQAEVRKKRASVR